MQRALHYWLAQGARHLLLGVVVVTLSKLIRLERALVRIDLVEYALILSSVELLRRRGLRGVGDTAAERACSPRVLGNFWHTVRRHYTESRIRSLWRENVSANKVFAIVLSVHSVIELSFRVIRVRNVALTLSLIVSGGLIRNTLVFDDVSGRHVDLELVRAELFGTTKLHGETLNDELFGEREVDLRAQLEQDILREERVTDAPEDGHLLLVRQFHLVRFLFYFLVFLFLLDVEHVLDPFRGALLEVDIGVLGKSLGLGGIERVLLLLEGRLAVVSLNLGEQGPQLRFRLLLSTYSLFHDVFSASDVLSD